MRLTTAACLLLGISTAGATGPAMAQRKSPSDIFATVAPGIVIVLGLDAAGKPVSQGSGVVIEPEVVVSNCHVFAGSRSAAIRYRGEQKTATSLHRDPERDVCSFSVVGLAAPPVLLAESSAANVGDRVYAIGAPRGLELTLSDGLVSSLREVPGGQMLQITAPISPGSSGGGLFDEQARLIGLTTLYLEESQQLNFAVPIEWIYELPVRHAQLVQRNSRDRLQAGPSDPPPGLATDGCRAAHVDYRQRYAEEWLQAFRSLNMQIPTLSPAERRWLKSEYDDTIATSGGRYTTRALAAAESREYQLRIAKPHTELVVMVLDRIVATPAPTATETALQWTYLVSVLLDREYWQAVENLARMGVIRPQINGVNRWYFEHHVLWSQLILTDIAVACLRDELSKEAAGD